MGGLARGGALTQLPTARTGAVADPSLNLISCEIPCQIRSENDGVLYGSPGA